MITKRLFGRTADGRQVYAYTIHDGDRSVTVLDYGGIVQSLIVPDRDGEPTDVVLGYHDIKSYEENSGYLGALIGRFGNRIEKGKLTIDGKTYALYCNNQGNHLHGGKSGFNQKTWDVEQNGNSLTLTILSPDGEENYPGNLKVKVVYTFENGALRISYRAVSDKKTAINLTNHAYFNLNGERDGSVDDIELFLDSDYITPTDEVMIPSGALRAVNGSAFDFNTPKEIGKDVLKDDVDLHHGKGYDHCYILKGRCAQMKQFAEAKSKKTGIVMRCSTDMPAVQFYSANYLDQEGKSTFYGARSGFCLETQAIPNNVNVPAYAEYESSIYDAGQEYSFHAVYAFDVE